VSVELREVPLEESVKLVDSDLHLREPWAPDGLHVEDATVANDSIPAIGKDMLERNE
jgi:hypothetical protein